MPVYLKKFYLAALQQIMNSGFPVHFFECATSDWAEIDFHPDLELIKNNITQYLEENLEIVLKDSKGKGTKYDIME